MKPVCCITGCELVESQYEATYRHGDLFRYGDMWIFNATPQVIPGAPRADQKVLHVDSTKETFERRDVFVIHKDAAHLNDAAVAYVGKLLG